MRIAFVLSVLVLATVPDVVSAEEPQLHPPAAVPVVHLPRWAPAFTDYQHLLWNDWSPAFYPGIYGPGWGGWWYMYFGHYYSPCYSPHLHTYPFYHYTHPYYNFPLDSKEQHLYIGLGNNTRPMPADYWERVDFRNTVTQKPDAAKVIVRLPADAKLIVNGEATELTSAERIFTTPELKQGKDYFYVLKAEVMRDGQTVTSTKEVAVFAGRASQVQFDLPGESTARK